MSDEPRSLNFKFVNNVVVTAHYEKQNPAEGKPFQLEICTPDGSARFTYEEWIWFSHTVAVLLKPKLLLED